ncbi:MAG: hypothetical protein DSO02_03905 [Hadesarchaea archaeon]|nr:MAG: hypothetical protein DSO02_03905 [Hadesarchaea archaeon]
MSTTLLQTLEVNPELCSECHFCRWACPYEAIQLEVGKKEGAKIDLEKCRTCGLCSSTCPSGAIRTLYYPEELLLSRAQGVETLILTCRGSSPPDLEKAVRESGVKGRPLEIRLPCLGRLDAGTMMKLLSQGIKELVVMPCEEEFCRFERGSRALERRFLLLRKVLLEMGRKEVLILRERSRKVIFNKDRCIWCGTCVDLCPYDAVKLLPSQRVAEFDLSKCMGCGICVARCPAFAIELEGFERSSFLSKVGKGAGILVLACQWAEFAWGDELAGMERRLPEGVELVYLPCLGLSDQLFVLEALRRGRKGVLVLGCPEEECKLEEGSKAASRYLKELEEKLEQVGLSGRVRFSTASPRDPTLLEKEILEFSKQLE